jgi:hypothetical protein
MHPGLHTSDGDAATLKIRDFQAQPYPVSMAVCENNGVTAIARLWADGDHRRCRLCPTCHADDSGLCLVTTLTKVADDDLELYSLRGFRDVGTDRPCLSATTSVTQ